MDETSPAVCKSPALTANRDRVDLKGAMRVCVGAVDHDGCEYACPESVAPSVGLSGILAELGTRGIPVRLLPIVVLLDMDCSLGMRRRGFLRLRPDEGAFRVP